VSSAEEARDIRVGDQERASAQAALAEHLAAGRIDVDEYAQRLDRCLSARTRRALLAVFEDLPQPRPDLPPATTHATANDALDATLGLAMLLGIPTAVVLGFAYGAWWTLCVPVAVVVLVPAVQAIVSHRARR
jgi:hypothetical protein